MFHIMICDDDPSYICALKNFLFMAGLPKNEAIFYEYVSGEQLISNLKRQKLCDLLILDIQLNQLDGHQTAARFRHVFPKSILVFCSGVFQPTDESFKYLPFRYLLKNYPEATMIRELKSIIEKVRFEKRSPYINGHYYYNTVRLKPEDILYIDNSRHGSNLHINKAVLKFDYDNHLTTNQKLTELYDILKDYGFEYAHNSYIVNMNYIVRMQSQGEITLIDETVLTVARSKLKTFRTAFAEWSSKKYEAFF